MSNYKKKQSNKLKDWSAQSWLVRKFTKEMRANNVNRIIVITEDNGGNIMSFANNSGNNKTIKNLTTSFLKDFLE